MTVLRKYTYVYMYNAFVVCVPVMKKTIFLFLGPVFAHYTAQFHVKLCLKVSMCRYWLLFFHVMS